ncbi:hypothetical protein EAG_08270 [Camponotus floridanus]|uniref:Uncharacterized protein n=1 Tax=Camponotus floridanus TaxID=104421 RepID=E2AR22_CAMFO|nr:hypothetical protein EAG_08270 [Camponotus floridanus]
MTAIQTHHEFLANNAMSLQERCPTDSDDASDDGARISINGGKAIDRNDLSARGVTFPNARNRRSPLAMETQFLTPPAKFDRAGCINFAVRYMLAEYSKFKKYYALNLFCEMRWYEFRMTDRHPTSIRADARQTTAGDISVLVHACKFADSQIWTKAMTRLFKEKILNKYWKDHSFSKKGKRLRDMGHDEKRKFFFFSRLLRSRNLLRFEEQKHFFIKIIIALLCTKGIIYVTKMSSEATNRLLKWNVIDNAMSIQPRTILQYILIRYVHCKSTTGSRRSYHEKDRVDFHDGEFSRQLELCPMGQIQKIDKIR